MGAKPAEEAIACAAVGRDVKSGHEKAVEFLLGRGANPNAPCRDGDTPLHKAAERGHLGIAQALIVGGAHGRVVNMYGKTPSKTADARAMHSVSKLIRSMCEDEISASPDPPLAREEHSIMPSASRGDTALRADVCDAICRGDTARLGYALRGKVDINAPCDGSEDTPLTLSIKYRQLEVCRMLLEHGASVGRCLKSHGDYFRNRPTPHNKQVSPIIQSVPNPCPPLHLATSMGWLDGVELLMRNLADPRGDVDGVRL